jgi:hypothetical protein
MPTLLDEIKPLIVNLRRKIDTETSWAQFRAIVETQTERLCRELNTRWLISVCDTYIDLGTDVERRNAMFVTMLANLEKVGQTFLMWRVNYDRPFEVPGEHTPRKLRLWDGMTSMHLDIGDVTNNLFRRLHVLLESTPHLQAIFNAVVARLATHETILGSLNKRHGHVFETDLKWRDAAHYDPWRANGELPALPAGSKEPQ